MSNRTDRWKHLVDEIMNVYSLADHWPDEVKMSLRERLGTELHKAFVAGEDDMDRDTKCPDAVRRAMEQELETWRNLTGNPIDLQDFIDEIAELRAFKEEWDQNDGNSPGYNLQKARNYGKQAAIFKSLYLAWRSTSMTLKSLTSISVLGIGNKAFGAARKLEKKKVYEWPEIFPEQIVEDPVNRMDPIEEANRRAQEEWKSGPTPFHDKHQGKRLSDLTIEELEEEVARRKGEGPFRNMSVLAIVVGTLSNGEKKILLNWEQQGIDPDSFSAQHNKDFLDLKVKRLEK